MNAITKFDTTALQQLNRALIGFDRMFSDRIPQQNSTYPPYNIIKWDDDNYELEMAVAGFNINDIDVEVRNNELIIRGEKTQSLDELDGAQPEYLHRGLAYRSFEKILALAEHMRVGDAVMKDGVLKIAVQRIIPDALKPRKIQVISHK